MSKSFYTLTEIKRFFEVEDDFLNLLENERIICPKSSNGIQDKQFSVSDVENLRLAKLLMEDLGVNLEGVEVILRLRQNMIDMRRQFDAILEDMAKFFKETIERMAEKQL